MREEDIDEAMHDRVVGITTMSGGECNYGQRDFENAVVTAGVPSSHRYVNGADRLRNEFEKDVQETGGARGGAEAGMP